MTEKNMRKENSRRESEKKTLKRRQRGEERGQWFMNIYECQS